jgi:primosomal protein N' (replication factor Y)
LEKRSGQKAPHATRRPYAARVSLLIPTHALPPLSYRIPEHLRPEVRVGAAVVAPLSGRHRLGIVVGFEGNEHAREDLLSVVPGLSLQPDLVDLCREISEKAAVPIPSALRAALPPGIDTSHYRLLQRIRNQPWEPGASVTRATLKRALGADGLREAESQNLIILDPSAPRPPAVEWAVVRSAANPDLSRAPRQRDVFSTLKERGGSSPTSALLAEAGASRRALRELVRRGAVRLVRRPELAPLLSASGNVAGPRPFSRTATGAVKNGGAFLWRTATREEGDAVAAIAAATLRSGDQVLVLAPEVRSVERMVDHLRQALRAGHTVAPYHGGLGRGRSAVYEAARDGAVDVVVGTRAAALLGLARPGPICVIDEPNDAHRAELGHEGLPVHVRDVALERARVEGTAAFFLSPFPSLKLYAAEVRRRERVRELPASRPERWPAVRIVDTRGSGAALSPTLVEVCRRCAEKGGRAALVIRRLGYASAVYCSHCGTMMLCPNCRLPLVLRGRSGPLVCTRCGHGEKSGPCSECGSDRVRPTGLGVERVRDELSDVLGTQVGLITADGREHTGASVVVGTAPRILDAEWDAVVLPDADAFLGASGVGAAERAFRLFYRAAESARGLLLIQTRLPEHYVLRAGVRGDFEAFAEAELPRLRSLAYPPFGHVAALTFGGSESAVLGAVESRLRPALGPEVEMSSPIPLGRAGKRSAWRVLLRSRGRSAVARAAAGAARAAARTHGLTVRVELDLEEV